MNKQAFFFAALLTIAWSASASAESIEFELPSVDAGTPVVNYAKVLFKVSAGTTTVRVSTCEAGTSCPDPTTVVGAGFTVLDNGDVAKVTALPGDTYYLEIGRDTSGCSQPDPRRYKVDIGIPPGSSVEHFAVAVFKPLNDSDSCCDKAGALPAPTPTVVWTGPGPKPQRRYPLDIVLVLDKSGSMNSEVSSGLSRLDLLNDKTTALIDLWDSWGSLNGNPDDGLFVIKYASSPATHVPYTLRPPTGDWPGPDDTGLCPAGETGLCIESSHGSTAIGSALVYAKDNIPGGGALDYTKDRVLVLVTDGRENPPQVELPEDGIAVGDDTEWCGMRVHPMGIELDSSAVARNLLNEIAIRQGGDDESAEFTEASDISEGLTNIVLHALSGSTPHTVLRVDGALTATAEHAVPVDPKMTTLWVQLDGGSQKGQLDVSLVDGDGNPLKVDENPRRGRTYVLKRYRVPARTSATWRAKVRSSDKRPSSTPYSLTVIAEDAGMALRGRFVDGAHVVGRPITLSVELRNDGKPWVDFDGKLQATVSKPRIGAGTALRAFSEKTPKLAKPDAVSFDGDATDLDRKAALLQASSEQTLQARSLDQKLQLRDDGDAASGDAKAGDGVYSARLKDVKTPGPYHFDIAIAGKGDGGSTITRTLSLTTNVEVGPMVQDKLVVQQLPKSCVDTADLTFIATPRDAEGNFLGPGYEHALRVQATLLPDTSAGTTPGSGSGTTGTVEGSPGGSVVGGPGAPGGPSVPGVPGPTPLEVSAITDEGLDGSYQFTLSDVPCDREVQVAVSLSGQPYSNARYEVGSTGPGCSRCEVTSNEALPSRLGLAFGALILVGLSLRTARRRRARR